MNEMFSLVEVLAIIGPAIAVVTSFVKSPPKCENVYAQDLERLKRASQDLSDHLKLAVKDPESDVTPAVIEYFVALVMLHGFHNWKGASRRMKWYRIIRATVFCIVILSVVFTLIYWTFATAMSKDAQTLAVLIVRGAAALSLISSIAWIMLLYFCSILYAKRLAAGL